MLSPESLSSADPRSITSDATVDVLEAIVAVLEAIVATRGCAPEFLRMDNGTELTAHALRDWCRFSSSGSVYIEPGSPWENPFIESFNGSISRVCAKFRHTTKRKPIGHMTLIAFISVRFSLSKKDRMTDHLKPAEPGNTLALKHGAESPRVVEAVAAVLAEGEGSAVA